MKKVHHGGNVEATAKRLGILQDQLLDFSANINPLGYPTSLKSVLVSALDRLPQYPDPTYAALRSAIAQHFAIDATQVLVSNGGAQMLDEVIRALPTNEAVVLAPTFGEYEHYFQRQQIPVHHFYLKAENNFELDMVALLNYLLAHPAINTLCLTNPNNPSGSLIDQKALKALTAFCNQHDRYLILDEAFIDLAVPAVPSFITSLQSNDHVVVVQSVTKFYAIPGLRLGYAVTKNPAMYRSIMAQQNPWSVNTLADVFGQLMYQQATFNQATRHWVETTAPQLLAALATIPQLRVFNSHTNFILFQAPVTDLKERLLEHRIMIRQCDDYEGLDATFYRVAVKDQAANQQLVACLRQVCEEVERQ